MPTPYILKSTGEQERFSSKKLKHSLEKAGADRDIVEMIVSHVEDELYGGMSTQEIYKHAFTLLRKYTQVSVRYSLRKAVAELGPDGFAFERLVGAILKEQGYKVKVGGILQGACVEHEVDVLAEKDDYHIFVECKFHNQHGIKTDLKVALYVKARHEDLEKFHMRAAKKDGRTPRIHDGWLVTNTKLTSKAIQYSQCAGLTVIGWDYPHEGNLQDLILEAKLHPLTCLTGLTQSQKRYLLSRENVVLCRELVRQPEVLRRAGCDQHKAAKVIEEIEAL